MLNTIIFFVCEGNTNQLLQQEKPKKSITFEWKKSPLDYDANVTSLKLSNIHHCQSVTSCFEAICFMHFIPFHLRLSPFFASAIVVHIVADGIVFFYRKIKSLPLIFFLFFRFFNFSSQKLRYSCVLLAWIVNIPFHHIVPARISKPTLWVADINYWIKWKVVKKVSRLRLYEEDSKLTFW